MDYLATEPVVDFLSEARIDGLDDSFCGDCKHPLTTHSRGMIIHDRCLILGCGCKQAVLTQAARKKVKHGILP